MKKDPSDLSWLVYVKQQLAASRILNGGPLRYGLSITRQTTEPIANFIPCKYYNKDGRTYYWFMFRDHRDYLHNQWKKPYKARKEFSKL